MPRHRRCVRAALCRTGARMSARILIYTAIGGPHGMGHASRCRALAQALVTRGAEVEFVTTTPALAAYMTPFACHCPTDITENSIFSTISGYEPAIAVFDTKVPLSEDLYPLIQMGCACPEPADHTTTIAVVRIDHPHATP